MYVRKPRAERLLVALLVLYGVTSLIHFTHNAEFLHEYPAMPGWLSRSHVYLAWVGQTAIGIFGYVLWRRGPDILGLSLIAAYAAFGFDGLGHYAVAAFGDHSVTMHVTIWLELVAAALLLGTAARHVARLIPGEGDPR